MAATQTAFEKERRKICFSTYFLLNVLILAHAQVTDNITTDASVNDTTLSVSTTPQTTPPTAATTQAQTTPAATSRPQTAFSQNSDLGPCPCDLTGNGCDVNCCCDPDCSANDRLAFSFCLPSSYISKTDDKVCFQQNVIIIENTPYEVNTTADGLFCVFQDNYAQRNFYNIPDIITASDTARLQTYINRYAGPSFQPDSRTDPRDYPDIYKSGATIYTVYESSGIGVLGLPATLHTSLCDDNNPVAYLYDQSSTCTRDLNDLGATCETSLAIKASTYYMGFKVVVKPTLFTWYFTNLNGTSISAVDGNTTSNSSKSSLVEGVTIYVAPPTMPSTPPSTTSPSVTEPYTVTANTSLHPDLCSRVVVDDLYNNTCVVEVNPQSPHMCVSSPGGIPQLCNYTALPQPQYNPTTGECYNAVTQVEYSITTNGTRGITQVDVQFVFTTIQQTDLPISQTFITNFKGVRELTPVERSGNPGYVVGQPVVAGQLVRQLDPVEGVTLLVVQLNGTKPEDNALTILKPSLSGDCNTGTGDRTDIVFGEDMRTGCFLSFNMSDMASGCRRMQEIALLALWPYGPDPPRNWSVATFGNSDPNTVGDWVTILAQNNPRAAVAGTGAECIDMVLGMHVQILYANVGSLANPQPKIVGVSFIYENPQTIAFQCIGPYCQPGAESAQQKFEVVQSVSFVDVSQPSAEMYAEAPLFLAKVPYDFFYPFGLGTGSFVRAEILIIILSLFLSIVMIGCFNSGSL